MHETYKKWLDDGCPKVYCQCGCSGEIIIKEYCKWRGIPKYINGHCPNSGGKKGRIAWNKGKKCPQISDALKNSEKFHEIMSSNEHKKNLSNLRKGHIPWNKGIPVPEKVKIKIGNTVKLKIEEGIIVVPHKSGKESPNWKGGWKFFCEICDKKIAWNAKRCRIHVNRNGKNNPNYNEGKSYGDYCEKWTNKKREEIRNEYDRKCYLCGKSEEQQINEQKERGKRGFRLSVHHVDEDKEQGCNGKEWKLVPLCISCHPKVRKHKIVI